MASYADTVNQPELNDPAPSSVTLHNPSSNPRRTTSESGYLIPIQCKDQGDGAAEEVELYDDIDNVVNDNIYSRVDETAI